MSDAVFGRALDDLIGDLAAGVMALGAGQPAAGPGVRPVSVELSLPVELRVVGVGPFVVGADVPAMRTRTAFDRPLGRLSLRLVAEVIE